MTPHQDISAPAPTTNNFSEVATPTSLAGTTTSKSWWRKPVQTWNNLSIRAKIVTLLVTGAVIPVVAVTQGILSLSKESALNHLKDRLKIELLILEKSVNPKRGRSKMMLGSWLSL